MNKTTLSYNEALKEIETIMKRFKQEEMSVDELASQVARATELISYCKERLQKAESDLKKVIE